MLQSGNTTAENFNSNLFQVMDEYLNSIIEKLNTSDEVLAFFFH